MPDDFWTEYGNQQTVEGTCGGDNLASTVLTAYGIPCDGSFGGGLNNLDIKHMDAIQVIKLSLLEESGTSGAIKELVMGADGNVSAKEIGYGGGSIGDVYYEVQSGSYIETCGGVMVIGGLPLAERKPVVWKPIWGETKQIYDTTLLYNEHCLIENFSLQATIVFNDPHLDSSFEDGIDNLYEITTGNPYDRILGYAVYMNSPLSDSSTSIKKEDTTTIMLPLPNHFGTFFKRPTASTMEALNPECYVAATTPDAATGVKIEIPADLRFTDVRGTDVDKLRSIENVYVIGLEISDMRGIPPDKAAALAIVPPEGSAKLIIKIDKTYAQCWKLSRGTHYVLASTGAVPVEPYVIFANNSRDRDPIFIDSKGSTPFSIASDSVWNNKGTYEGTGMILPTESTKGILVKSMFVSAILDSPSIVVFSPDGRGNRAKLIAERLKYNMAALVSIEKPRPVAFNGTLIDMSEGMEDHDPTTTQSFTDTAYEQALDAMNGGGMTLNLSFLDENGCEGLSRALQDYFGSGAGIETTYVCGPDADPQLGSAGPGGGIVNSITYSYQDSSSYTISVNCGPRILGDFAQVDGGPSPMRTEDISAVGTVLNDMGNNVNFKVKLDGYGVRTAINLTHHIIRVGDQVSCSVHNNPVES